MRSYAIFLLLAACGGESKSDTADTGADTEPADTDTDTDTDADADADADTDADTDTDTGLDSTFPSTPPDMVLALVGSYTDEWGVQHEITEATWTQTYPGYPSDVFYVLAWDGLAQWLTAQNDAANYFNPGLFSRFDWHDAGSGDLWYCQTVYDAASEAEALEAARADAADLAAGCGGFGWTHLTP